MSVPSSVPKRSGRRLLRHISQSGIRNWASYSSNSTTSPIFPSGSVDCLDLDARSLSGVDCFLAAEKRNLCGCCLAATCAGQLLESPIQSEGVKRRNSQVDVAIEESDRSSMWGVVCPRNWGRYRNCLVQRFGRVLRTNRDVSVCEFAEALGKPSASPFYSVANKKLRKLFQ